nr:unnamed protein product [Digitaria exilis]
MTACHRRVGHASHRPTITDHLPSRHPASRPFLGSSSRAERTPGSGRSVLGYRDERSRRFARGSSNAIAGLASRTGARDVTSGCDHFYNTGTARLPSRHIRWRGRQDKRGEEIRRKHAEPAL